LAKTGSGRPDGERNVWLDGTFIAMPVFKRETLTEGTAIAGPAIVESYDSTTYLAPKWSLMVEGDLLMLQRENS
jgi:N-methylhydantoinase A